MSDQLLTHEEAAAYLRRSTKGLYDMNYRGTGPTRIQAGGRVLYRRRDLDAWLDQHAVQAANAS